MHTPPRRPRQRLPLAYLAAAALLTIAGLLIVMLPRRRHDVTHLDAGASTVTMKG